MDQPLLQAVGAINSSLDLATVLRQITESARELLHADIARIALREPGEESLVFRHGMGASDALAPRADRGHSDVARDARFDLAPDVRARLDAGGYGAVLVIPLIAVEGAFGSLVIADQVGRVYQPREVRLAQAFATILLVEDQEELRRFVTEILERHGYHVLSAATPTAALALASRDGLDVGLLLTDVVMPEMSGAETARLLRARRPGLRVLYMTGYPGEALDSGAPEGQVIKKPFSSDDLLRLIRAILEAAEGGR